MLRRLYIKNIALIKEGELNLDSGLNIITGETGAGKSLILGSLSLLLGAKSDKTIIRNGEKDAYVEAIFDINNKVIFELKKIGDFDLSDGNLIISRKISKNKNLAQINGQTVTNKILTKIVSCLIDICGQRDNMILLNKDSHLSLLDKYAFLDLKTDFNDVSKAFLEYKKWYLQMGKFNINDTDRIKKLDYDNFVFNEIENATLRIGEDEEIEKDFKRMNNAFKITQNLNIIHESLTQSNFSNNLRLLNQIKDMDEDLNQLSLMATDVDSLISDFQMSVGEYLDNINFSDEEFQNAENRLNLINSLKAKYGRTIEDILKHQENISKEIEELNDYEHKKNIILENVQKSREALDKYCFNLSEKRKKYSKEFCSKIKEILLELEFNYVDIDVLFSKTDAYTLKGYDKMGFMISLNKGESLKPLEDVASGGELSRIMLAIKSLLAGAGDEKTLIFDEIDTGIGGKTALSISDRLLNLSKNTQIICITHLPQVAAAADAHYLIYKAEKYDRTNTFIMQLNEMDSIKELAKMMSGDPNSEISIKNAKELKESFKKSK